LIPLELDPPPPPPQAAMSRDVAMIKNRLRRFNVLGIKIHVGIFNRFYECTHKIKKDIEYLGYVPMNCCQFRSTTKESFL
jgi:hypothetical protein